MVTQPPLKLFAKRLLGGEPNVASRRACVQPAASCERVFALLRHLFGEQHDALAGADYVQAALTLNHNQRNVG